MLLLTVLVALSIAALTGGLGLLGRPPRRRYVAVGLALALAALALLLTNAIT